MSSQDGPVAWREILNRKYASRLATMIMAIWLHAANSNLTATTLPSAVDDIGGLNLMSWAFALYLAGSIAAGASSSLLVNRHGIRNTMIRFALLYMAGCCVCAAAPTMLVLLGGRVMQGLGGGGLVALVYIAQDRFFPNRFVPRIVAILSMAWMISSFIGPTLGGAFATWGLWRYAYWTFAFQALILVFAVHHLLGLETSRIRFEDERIPIVRLLFLGGAIVLVSLAGSEYHPLWSGIFIASGGVLFVLFVLRDRRARSDRMLPLEATRPGHAVCAGILATFLLAMSIMSFVVYAPLILIRLYELTPFTAGLFVLIESLAWGTAAILFSRTPPARESTLIRTGCVLVFFGLAGLGFALANGPLWLLVVFLIINNGGFGMMWGFIIRRIVNAAPDHEKDRTASTIPITQQAGFAIGAALAGLIANGLGLTDQADAESMRVIAFWLFAGFLPVAFIGVVSGFRLTAPSGVNQISRPDQSNRNKSVSWDKRNNSRS